MELIRYIPWMFGIPDEWWYFRVENLHFRGDDYTILYDKTGEKYHSGKGIVIQKQ